MYTAHISDDKKREQSVFDHCMETAVLARKYGELCGMASISETSGITHDFGKLTRRFDGYIHGDDSIKRGEIDHSYAGAKFVNTQLANPDIKGCAQAAELIGHVIVSHHGLHDWCNIDHPDYYSERTSKNEDYNEISDEINRGFDMDKLHKLMSESADEYVRIVGKAKEMIRGLSSENRGAAFAFYMG